MAKVVFEFIEPSAAFEKRVLFLKEDVPFYIGRSTKNNVPTVNNAFFESRVVSTIHAVILYKKEKFLLEDKSRNGTFINGYKLNPGTLYPIISGDVIELGVEAFFNSVTEQGIIIYVKLFPREEDEVYECLQEQYPLPLQMYLQPPLFEYNFEDLMASVRERLLALQVISNIGECDYNENKWILTVTERMKEKNLNKFCEMVMGTAVNSKEEYIQRKRDHVSHFILLLGCCRQSTTRKWFLHQESKLFRIRWHFLSSSRKNDFLKRNNIKFYKPLESVLKSVIAKSDGFLVPGKEYFEMKFQETSDLIRKRQIFVHEGMAYISLEQTLTPITNHFGKHLFQNLKVAKEKLHKGGFDQRTYQILKQVENEARYDPFSLQNFKLKERFSPSKIDFLSKESFPLCMRTLQHYLTRDSHLKNGGRFQYNLFLKGIGVPLVDALSFWQHHFTKKISLEKFVRDYSYHIRHGYGQVGKLADYPPLSCDRILEVTPGPLEHHGCPFKVDKVESLRRRFKECGIEKPGTDLILSEVEKGMPQAACSIFFKLTHGRPLSISTLHPNIYFIESRKIRNQDPEENQASSSSPKKKKCLCSSRDLEW